MDWKASFLLEGNFLLNCWDTQTAKSLQDENWDLDSRLESEPVGDTVANWNIVYFNGQFSTKGSKIEFLPPFSSPQGHFSLHLIGTKVEPAFNPFNLKFIASGPRLWGRRHFDNSIIDFLTSEIRWTEFCLGEKTWFGLFAYFLLLYNCGQQTVDAERRSPLIW